MHHFYTTQFLEPLQRLASLLREKRGAVSVEFAFIMPLLITLFLGTMEVSEGLEVNKKIGRAASTVADVAASPKQIEKADIEDVLKIGASQLLPYGRSKPVITVVAVQVDAALNAKVQWSRQINTDGSFTTPFAKNSNYTGIPGNLLVDGRFLITSTAKIEYLPLTSWSIQKNKGTGATSYAAVDMKETYYFQARQGSVPCADCP